MNWLSCFTPLWKLLLLLYPLPFRQRFGAEMLQVLATIGQQQAQQRGRARRVHLSDELRRVGLARPA